MGLGLFFVSILGMSCLMNTINKFYNEIDAINKMIDNKENVDVVAERIRAISNKSFNRKSVFKINELIVRFNKVYQDRTKWK